MNIIVLLCNQLNFKQTLHNDGKTTFIKGEETISYKSLDQAKDGRDALVKHMYERLFGWIVKKINTSLHPR